MLSLAEGKIVNAVKPDVVRWHVGGIVISQPEPLVETEVRFAQKLDIFRNLRLAGGIVDPAVATGGGSRIGGRERARESIEPLESQSARIAPLDLDLGGMRVGVTDLLHHAVAEVTVRIHEPEGAVAVHGPHRSGRARQP